jgi:hypothetical protein
MKYYLEIIAGYTLGLQLNGMVSKGAQVLQVRAASGASGPFP